MNEKKAKRIRSLIYGDYSPRAREYETLPNGQIIADKRRRNYQRGKKTQHLILS